MAPVEALERVVRPLSLPAGAVVHAPMRLEGLAVIVHAVAYPHVMVDASGRARVGQSGVAIAQLVAESTAYGWRPAELHFQHPELALAEVHAALAFSWDNAAEVDRALAAELDDLAHRAGQDSRDLRALLTARSPR